MQKKLKNLGINIKSERLRKDISQEQLAALTGISRNYISLIETGKFNPTIVKLLNIADALNVDISKLIEGI